MNFDFAMQEVLTVVIVLLIVGVVLDGIRRMRQSRRDSIKMSRNMGVGMNGDGDSEGNFSSELPNGGARISQRDPDEIAALSKARKIPEQVTLNLDEQVPMLMDSVGAADDDNGGGAGSGRVEPSFAAEASPSVAAANSDDGDVEDDKAAAEPEEVIIINVMAPSGYRFHGEDLLKVLLDNGMRFGTMNIFHRHLESDGSGEILFSMANMVMPGTFDLDEMSSFETPGVSFFLTLPIEADSLLAFEAMVSTTSALCSILGGELKDENRSVMTQQTVEHCRQRVKDFSRKQLYRG